MRVLLLTDSLGCPREETNVSDTWVDRILRKWSGKEVNFYTYCVHGLSASRIDVEYLREIQPDIIIMQIGIVDACRRALGKYEFEIVKRIPWMGNVVKKFCGKYHYVLSAVRNVHYCSRTRFFKVVSQICEESIGEVFFLKIALPGSDLVKKTYNVEKDVYAYNSIVGTIPKLKVVDPYGNRNPDTFLLSDGHHLNPLGNELLYKTVDDIIYRDVISMNGIRNNVIFCGFDEVDKNYLLTKNFTFSCWFIFEK